MSGIGLFLEFAVRTPDILESLSFYKALGFSELDSGEVWEHRYAVVSDGSLCIGLHDHDFDAPCLSFVQPDLARHARAMADHGFDFDVMHVDEDTFNHIGLADLDRHRICMLEARTFHAADAGTGDSACGSCFELTLPVRDAMRSARFWAPLAPVVLRLREEPTMHLRFDAGGMPVGLSESIALDRPGLCFNCTDREPLQHCVDMHDVDLESFPGFEGAFARLTAPEGTHLYLFDEDFLGAGIVVDEDVDADDIIVE